MVKSVRKILHTIRLYGALAAARCRLLGKNFNTIEHSTPSKKSAYADSSLTKVATSCDAGISRASGAP